jgi:hypothetical protein
LLKGMNRWQIFGGMDEGKQHAGEMVNKISHGSASLPESTIEGCDVDAKNRTGSNILSRMVNDCFHIPKRWWPAPHWSANGTKHRAIPSMIWLLMMPSISSIIQIHNH